MRKSLLIAAALCIVLIPSAACRVGEDETRTYLAIEGRRPSTGEEAPDDVVPTPGGYAYRANVHVAGVEDIWVPIESGSAVLGSGSDSLNISYRDYIETPAGETRNNIIHIGRTS